MNDDFDRDFRRFWRIGGVVAIAFSVVILAALVIGVILLAKLL